jgi:ribonuclease R
MKMELKEKIMEYMKEDAYRPLSAEDLAEGMQLSEDDLTAFWPALAELEETAAVIKNRSDLYGLPERMNLVVGRLSMSGKGYGFIIPDVREKETDTDVFVPGAMLASAMHNDRVVARVTPSSIPGRSREGEIIRIVTRANTKIVGTFESSRTFGFVTPDDQKIGQDVFIPKKAFNGARAGMKVVAEITKWPDGRRNSEGQITELLGKAGDPGVDVLAVMRQYDLQETFPPEVQAAADQIQQSVGEADRAGRRDRRNFQVVTVDGDDSKDFDDGVYAEKRPDGGWFLGVYIADVSWYVRENEPLDREARERGTSVYLVDRVIPMLPFALSNGICSLNQGQDRLALGCEMEISPEGRVSHYEIVPVVINVYRRLTYNIVNKVLVDKDPACVSDNEDLLPMLETMASLRNALKKRRHARGSIDFDLPEVKVQLDAEGHPIALIKRAGSLAESMIEECMLLANETVAEHMDKKELPFVYRVHEQPTKEKIERLNGLLETFGQHVQPNEEGEIRPADVQRVLENVTGRPEERIVSAVSLRSMQQARYADQSLGHFGLAARYYTHFTSPIRRYPDLIVHRLLRETFATGTIPAGRQDQLRGLLPEIAEHASVRERVAVDAERETTEMKEIEYMAQFVGDTFTGIISGVTAFGLFIELENGVEGLVHVSRMVNDYYEYVEAQYALIGERTHQAYRLGDTVEVVLVRANVEERNIDFILKDNGVYVPEENKSKTSARPGRSSGGSRRGGAASGSRKPAGSKNSGSSRPAAVQPSRQAEPDKPKQQAEKTGQTSASSRKNVAGRRNTISDGNRSSFGRKKKNEPADTLPHRAVWPDPPEMHAEDDRKQAAKPAVHRSFAHRRSGDGK